MEKRWKGPVTEAISLPVLLAGAELLAIRPEAIKDQAYLGTAGSGYLPNYSVWMAGVPVLIAENATRSAPSLDRYRDLCGYARSINSKYSGGLNPCRFVLVEDGTKVFAGHFDANRPALELDLVDIAPGTVATSNLASFCGIAVLEAHARTYLGKLKIERGIRPFASAGGQPLLLSKRALNSFAAALSPVLRRYFSSNVQENIREI